MRRREFVTGLGSAAAWPLPTRAQQKVWQIGMLDNPLLPNSIHINAFRRGLRDKGYVEGQNIKLEYRGAGDHQERFTELAQDLVGLKVDVIVTAGTPPVLAAKKATSTIPIVMAGLGDPVGNGVVASLSHPGGNITGLSISTTETQAKRLQILTDLVPGLSRVAALYNLANPNVRSQWQETQEAGRSLNVALQLLDVGRVEDIAPAFDAAVRQQAEALIVAFDGFTQINRRPIVELAAETRLPAVYAIRDFVDVGGLVFYGVDVPDFYYRAAGFVDRIIKGAKPADMPIELPTKFQLVFNLKTAKALGVVIPPLLVASADDLIE